MNLSFPKLPEYGYTWRTIYVEPIPDSGERIALAVVLKGVDNALITTKVVSFAKLKSAFGGQMARRLNDALNLCLKSAENYYGNLSLSNLWQPPLEGFSLSDLRESLANNIDEGVIAAAVQSSSLYLGVQIESSNIVLDTISAQKWRSSISKQVLKIRSEYSNCFQHEITLRGHGMPLKIGFMSDKYIAHFDSISPSSSKRSEALIRAQSKLWQLDQLRDNANLLFSPDKFELVLHRPKIQKESSVWLDEFFEEVQYEASRRDLSLYTSSSSFNAANHVILSAA